MKIQRDRLCLKGKQESTVRLSTVAIKTALFITSQLTLAESHWKQLELGHRQLLARLLPSMHIKTEYSGYSHSAIN